MNLMGKFFDREKDFINQLLGTKSIRLNAKNIDSYIKATDVIIKQNDPKKINILRLKLNELVVSTQDPAIKKKLFIVLKEIDPPTKTDINQRQPEAKITTAPAPQPKEPTQIAPESPESKLERIKAEFLNKCTAPTLLQTQDDSGNTDTLLRYHNLSQYEKPLSIVKEQIRTLSSQKDLSFTPEESLRILIYTQQLKEFYFSIEKKLIICKAVIRELINNPGFKRNLVDSLKPIANLSHPEAQFQRIINRILEYYGNQNTLSESLLSDHKFMNYMLEFYFRANLGRAESALTETSISREQLILQNELATLIEHKLNLPSNSEETNNPTLKTLLQNEALKVVVAEILPYQFVVEVILAPDAEFCNPDIMTRLIQKINADNRPDGNDRSDDYESFQNQGF